jgi:hypothetical protein
LTDDQKAAIADLQEDCFAKIPIDKRLDASRYSVLQINTLKKIDSPLYRCLSFLHCSNELIHDTVLDESSNKPSEFPYNCRKDAITINKYAIAARKSPHQVEMYRQKSLEELHNVAQSLNNVAQSLATTGSHINLPLCMGIDIDNILVDAQLGEFNQLDYQEGFKDFVRMAIRDKADSLKKIDSVDRRTKEEVFSCKFVQNEGFLESTAETNSANEDVFACLHKNEKLMEACKLFLFMM